MTLLCVFITTCHVNLRSLQVSGAPSCHLMLWPQLVFERQAVFADVAVGDRRNFAQRVRERARVCVVAHRPRKHEHREVERRRGRVEGWVEVLGIGRPPRSEARPGCVHGWRPPAALPLRPTLLQPASSNGRRQRRNANAATCSSGRGSFLAASASIVSGSMPWLRQNRDTRPVRSPMV